MIVKIDEKVFLIIWIIRVYIVIIKKQIQMLKLILWVIINYNLIINLIIIQILIKIIIRFLNLVEKDINREIIFLKILIINKNNKKILNSFFEIFKIFIKN